MKRTKAPIRKAGNSCSQDIIHIPIFCYYQHTLGRITSLSVLLHLLSRGNTGRLSHKGRIAWFHDGQPTGRWVCKAGLVSRRQVAAGTSGAGIHGLIFLHRKTLTPSEPIAPPRHDRTHCRSSHRNPQPAGFLRGCLPPSVANPLE